VIRPPSSPTDTFGQVRKLTVHPPVSEHLAPFDLRLRDGSRPEGWNVEPRVSWNPTGACFLGRRVQSVLRGRAVLLEAARESSTYTRNAVRPSGRRWRRDEMTAGWVEGVGAG
jgi:hypothetical protein